MDWLSILTSVLISLVPATAVAFITVRLSLKQFYSKKWWEKKAESYSAISKDLANLLFCVKEINSELGGGKKLDDHRRETLGNEYRRRLDSLKITAAGGDFISSKEVSRELMLLVDDLEKKSNNLTKEFIGDDFRRVLEDYYKDNYRTIETYKDKFNDLAKKDLNIK